MGTAHASARDGRAGGGRADSVARRCVLRRGRVKKFLFRAEWGASRFAHIGIPFPTFTGPSVAAVEIVCGALILAGFLTRVAATSVLVDISVAIATTKIPVLLHRGFFAWRIPPGPTTPC